MLTKVEVRNTASRHAVEKASFAEVAIMRLTRFGLRKRVEIVPCDPIGVTLAERLGAGSSRGRAATEIGQQCIRALRAVRARAFTWTTCRHRELNRSDPAPSAVRLHVVIKQA